MDSKYGHEVFVLQIQAKFKGMSDRELLSIKTYGHEAPEFIPLEQEFGILHRRTLLAGAADALIERKMMNWGIDFDSWWETFS